MFIYNYEHSAYNCICPTFLGKLTLNEYSSMLEKVCTKSIETVGIENIIER